MKNLRSFYDLQTMFRHSDLLFGCILMIVIANMLRSTEPSLYFTNLSLHYHISISTDRQTLPFDGINREVSDTPRVNSEKKRANRTRNINALTYITFPIFPIQIGHEF